MFATKVASPKAAGAGPAGDRAPPSRSSASVAPAVSGRADWDFAQVPLAPPGGGALPLGRTDDPLEAEADRLADEVMCSAPHRTAPRGPPGPGAPMMTRRAPSGVAVTAGTASGLFRGAGQPLDAASRAFFEPRFGLGLAAVRVHADAAAARSAASIGARAFAAGSHIGFAANQYAPASPAGRRLLAHELAHVAQAAGPGVAPVVRRSPTKPNMFDTGTQTFSDPASTDTVKSLKAAIEAQKKTTPPQVGANVDVKGTSTPTEELFVWNILSQRISRQNWGTVIQVVARIGPKPPDPPGGAAPVGEIVLTIDQDGNATAELLDRGPVAVPAGFPDEAKAVAALKADFGFKSVDNGSANWTVEELNKVHAGLSKLSATERLALKDVKLVRESALANAAGKSLDAEFSSSHSVTAGSVGTAAVATHDASLSVANSMFNADDKGFLGEKGNEILPSLGVVIHEAGHAVETKALRDAQVASDEAQAVVNNDILAMNAANTDTSTAVGVANTDAIAARNAAAAYTGAVATGAAPLVRTFNAALRAINTYANNTTGSQFATQEAAASAAITARNTALAALPAGNPAATDFASAIASQDAWFAQARIRAAASIKLDASKADLKTKQDAQKKVTATAGGGSKRLEEFVKVVNADRNIKPLTQYAKDNWPGHPEEFFAEAFFLWETQPTYLADNAPKLKAWFDAGNHLK